MSQALYRKWRPRQWAEVIGQEHVIQTLKNAVQGERIGHAYLFAGPRGTGKTTTARLLAKAVNCLEENPGKRPCDACELCVAVNESRLLDLIEIDAASNTSVDDVRDLREKINFSPTTGKFKVYIIDEVHMLSTAAFNALLKTLEEPPPHAIFILATTEAHRIPATVLSRCQRHEFRRIPVVDIVQVLTKICKDEGIEYEPEALTMIARQATGSMRDGISLLDQLSSTGEKVTLEMALTVSGTATNHAVVKLMDGILARDAGAGLSLIHKTLDTGADPRQFARQIVEYLRNLLLIKLGNASQIDETMEMLSVMAKHAQEVEQDWLVESIRLFNTAASDRVSSWHPALLLELAVTGAVTVGEVRPSPATEVSVPKPVEVTESGKAAEKPKKTKSQEKKAEVPKTSMSVEDKVEESLTEKPEIIETPSQGTTQPEADQSDELQEIAEGDAKEVGFQDIVAQWKEVSKLVSRQSGKTGGLLNSCKLLGLKRNILILGFQSELLQSKMEAGDNIELTCKAIAHLLKANVQIKCVVSDQETGIDLDDLDVEVDGMVGEALNLGGKIAHKK